MSWRAIAWARLLAAAPGVVAVAVAVAFAGCASLPPGANADNASNAEGSPTAPGDAPNATLRGSTTSLEIEAPLALRELLQKYLDLARLVAQSEDESLDDTEWLRLIGAAPAQVRELLQTEGYFAPEVRVRREVGPALRVIVSVVPGPRARIKGFVLNVQGPLQGLAVAGDSQAREQIETLRGSWPLRAGTPFRNRDWSDAKSATVARLRAQGYATASIVDSSAEVQTTSQSVDLTLTIDSGARFLTGQLRIEGLRHHDETSVRHLAGFGPGTPLTEVLLLDYQDRLRKSGLFDSAVVTFDGDPAHAGAALVTVQLQELPLQSATVGVGVSANTGPRTTAEHTHRRILGWNATLHNKAEWGRDRQAWEGELSTHPGEGFYRNLVGTQIERLKTDTDVVLSQRARLGRTQDTTRVERLYFVALDRSVQTTSISRKDAQALSLQYHGVWRDVDSVILPTSGFTFSGQAGAGWAHSSYASSGPFGRTHGRATGYLPLGRSWFSIGRLELGHINKRADVALPDSLAFRAGGDDSVRGYPYRSLAPTDANGVISGGNVLMTASAELARPFADSLPSLWGAVFIDAGRAANSWSALKPALGYGIGVRWRSPVGPLRLDWAYGEELHKARLHLSVGIAF